MECYIIVDKAEITTCLSLGYCLRKIKTFHRYIENWTKFCLMENDVTQANNQDYNSKFWICALYWCYMKLLFSLIQDKAFFWMITYCRFEHSTKQQYIFCIIKTSFSKKVFVSIEISFHFKDELKHIMFYFT